MNSRSTLSSEHEFRNRENYYAAAVYFREPPQRIRTAVFVSFFTGDAGCGYICRRKVPEVSLLRSSGFQLPYTTSVHRKSAARRVEDQAEICVAAEFR